MIGLRPVLRGTQASPPCGPEALDWLPSGCSQAPQRQPASWLLWRSLPPILSGSTICHGCACRLRWPAQQRSWPSYLLARRVMDERAALLGAGLLIFDPFLLAHGRLLQMDGLLAADRGSVAGIVVALRTGQRRFSSAG